MSKKFNNAKVSFAEGAKMYSYIVPYFINNQIERAAYGCSGFESLADAKYDELLGAFAYSLANGISSDLMSLDLFLPVMEDANALLDFWNSRFECPNNRCLSSSERLGCYQSLLRLQIFDYLAGKVSREAMLWFHDCDEESTYDALSQILEDGMRDMLTKPKDEVVESLVEAFTLL